jgi:hypothetical protein
MDAVAFAYWPSAVPGHCIDLSHARHTKKKGDLQQVAFHRNRQGRSGAAGSLGSAAGATGTKVYPAVQLKTVLLKIHLDGLGFFHKIGVDDELEAVDVKRRVRVGKLIQSHGQAGAPSAAFVEENTNRFDIFSLEVFGNLLNCRLCDLEHDTLLGYIKIGPERIRIENRQVVSAVEFNHVHRVCQSQFKEPSDTNITNPVSSIFFKPDFH